MDRAAILVTTFIKSWPCFILMPSSGKSRIIRGEMSQIWVISFLSNFRRFGLRFD